MVRPYLDQVKTETENEQDSTTEITVVKIKIANRSC